VAARSQAHMPSSRRPGVESRTEAVWASWECLAVLVAKTDPTTTQAARDRQQGHLAPLPEASLPDPTRKHTITTQRFSLFSPYSQLLEPRLDVGSPKRPAQLCHAADRRQLVV